MKIKFFVEMNVDTNEYNIDSEIEDNRVYDIGLLSNQIASLFKELSSSYPKKFYEQNVIHNSDHSEKLD